jgi:SnoaL-like domain
MAGEKLTAEDRWDIMDLFARYAWAVDTGDVESFVRQFAPGASIQEEDELFEGEEGLRTFMRRFRHLPSFPGRQHWIGQVLIEGDRERCTARSFAMATHLNRGTGSTMLTFLGHYDDVIVNTGDGIWKFERRRFGRWGGDVLQGFPAYKAVDRETGEDVDY